MSNNYWSAAFGPITWELEFCQAGDWWWNSNNNMTLNFRLFQGKINDNIFYKTQKNLFQGYFGPFLSKFGQTNFPGKKGICHLSVFRYSNYLPSCKKSMIHSWEKCWTYGQTVRQNGDFIGPSIAQGSK